MPGLLLSPPATPPARRHARGSLCCCRAPPGPRGRASFARTQCPPRTPGARPAGSPDSSPPPAAPRGPTNPPAAGAAPPRPAGAAAAAVVVRTRSAHRPGACGPRAPKHLGLFLSRGSEPPALTGRTDTSNPSHKPGARLPRPPRARRARAGGPRGVCAAGRRRARQLSCNPSGRRGAAATPETAHAPESAGPNPWPHRRPRRPGGRPHSWPCLVAPAPRLAAARDCNEQPTSTFQSLPPAATPVAFGAPTHIVYAHRVRHSPFPSL